MKEFVDGLIETFKIEEFRTELIAVGDVVSIINQQAEKFATDIKSGNKDRWIPCEERYPDTTDYILLSFSNFPIPVVGRWEEDEEGGAFYVGDETESCVSQGMFVNAWQQLPKVYRPGEEKDSAKNTQTRIERIRSMSVEEMADRIMESGIDTMIDFCQNFCGECKNISESECRKCLIKYLNSPERKKVKIPTEHFENRFNTVV